MIYAKKNKIIKWMFQLVQKRLLRKQFSKLYVKDLRKSQFSGLYIGNHSTWWDPILLSELDFQKKLNNAFVMTDYKGLKRVPIFKYIGAYSIDKEDSKHVMASLRYTEKLLKSGENVFIFPQGEERHQEKRPLQFQQGIGVVLKRVPHIPIIPVTFYYTFREEKRQEVWVIIGEPLILESSFKRQQIIDKLEHVVTTQLEELKNDVINNRKETYERLI